MALEEGILRVVPSSRVDTYLPCAQHPDPDREDESWKQGPYPQQHPTWKIKRGSWWEPDMSKRCAALEPLPFAGVSGNLVLTSLDKHHPAGNGGWVPQSYEGEGTQPSCTTQEKPSSQRTQWKQSPGNGRCETRPPASTQENRAICWNLFPIETKCSGQTSQEHPRA